MCRLNNHKNTKQKTEAVSLLFISILIGFSAATFYKFLNKESQVYYWPCAKSAAVLIRKEFERIHYFSDYKSFLQQSACQNHLSIIIIKHQLDWEKLHSNLTLTHSNTDICNYKTSFVYVL